LSFSAHAAGVLCGCDLSASGGRRLAGGASLAFYGYWRIEHTALLVTSIVFNYFFGEWILRARAGETISRACWPLRWRRISPRSRTSNTRTFSCELPPTSQARISRFSAWSAPRYLFFTFTQIAYLVDVHAGKVIERKPVHYALFVTYFLT
jgi:D-alanyl-lipoteichoic acid acyltransferase DltB (MBOAT superfamily)